MFGVSWSSSNMNLPPMPLTLVGCVTPKPQRAMSCVLVHLANVSYRLGRTLHWDEKTWSVKNDPEANKMLTRVYRAPYIVPAKV